MTPAPFEPLEPRMLLSAADPLSSLVPAAISAPEASATSDFDDDGDNDLVFRNEDTGGNRYLRLDSGAANGSVPLPSLAGSDWELVGVADFDGDLDPDLLFRHEDNYQTRVWLMDGTVRQGIVNLPFAGRQWEVSGAGDFTGDGIADIVWRNMDDRSGRVVLWSLDSTGTFEASVPLTRVANPAWTIAGVGDFDGDGDADLYLRNAYGANAIWRFNQTGFVSAVASRPLRDLDWEVGDVRDFNGDGEADIAWRHDDTHQTVIWFMQNNGTQLDSSTRIVGLNTSDWELPLEDREDPTRPGGGGPNPWPRTLTAALAGDHEDSDADGADSLLAIEPLVTFVAL